MTIAGCDSAAPGCFDRSLAYIRIAPDIGGLVAPPEGESVAGRFLSWTPGDVRFLADDGRELGFLLEPEPDAPLPDLSFEAVGPVRIVAEGFAYQSDLPSLPTLTVRRPDRSLLMQLGNDEHEGPGLSVRAPRNLDACSSYSHEDGTARNKPSVVAVMGLEAELYQGEGLDVGDLRFDLLASQSNNRAHPWAPCSVADCPWEKLAWMLWDPGLPQLVFE